MEWNVGRMIHLAVSVELYLMTSFAQIEQRLKLFEANNDFVAMLTK